MSSDSFSPEATRLVSVTGMDRLALHGLQQYLLRGQKRNEGRVLSEQEKRFHECVDRVDASTYAPALSSELSKHMSRAEIRQAISFFESDVGKKLIGHDPQTLTKLFSGYPAELHGLSSAEVNELEQFKRTPAGKKIFVDGILNFDPIADLLAKKGEDVLRGCAKESAKK